jgi:hypothetical protein
MSRVPEKMSFTHAELGADQRIRRPREVSTSFRSRAATENLRPAAAPVTLDTIVARRGERSVPTRSQAVRGKGAMAIAAQATTENKLRVTAIEIRPAKKW